MKMIEGGVIAAVVLLAVVGTGTAAPNAAETGGTRAAAVSEPAPDADQEASAVRGRQATGVIVAVDREANTVRIKDRTGERTFALSPRVQIKLGKLKATLAEVQPGKRVFIRYRDVEGTAFATTVKVL